MLILTIAWRNVWRNGWRSTVIMLSVAIGLLAGTLVLALYKGMMNSRVQTVIRCETAHLQLHHPAFREEYDVRYFIPGLDTVLHLLRQNPAVREIATRSIVQGMLISTTGSAGVSIIGIEAEKEKTVSSLQQKLKAEDVSTLKKNQILIGKKLADKLNIEKKNKVVLTFTDTAGNLVSAAFRTAAIYQSDNSSYDEQHVFVQGEALNELLLTNGQAHELAILLHRDEAADSMKLALAKRLPLLTVSDWKDLSPETQLLVVTVDYYSLVIMGIILTALAFGILNTMLMAILERSRELSMMLALGTGRMRILGIVFMETVFLTASGAPFGLLASWLIVHYFNLHGLDLSGMGEEMLSSFGFSRIVYPALPFEKIPDILLLVVLTALLAGIIPAIRALRLRPAENLKM